MQVATSLLCLYATYRHDYVVKGKTQRLATPVKHKNTEDEGDKEEKEEGKGKEEEKKD